MKTILITGGKGQLASCIQDLDQNINDFTFIYVDYDELDITNKAAVEVFFNKNKIDYCVNCAAYTAVDKAESEQDIAKYVNEIGAKNLAEACKKCNSTLIQISTDFVFDGSQSVPYNETDTTNPISVYGSTKLGGEVAITHVLENHFIIRTAWLYSEHGNNFLKTILKLGKEREELNIISDQIGTPTYAGDLAEVIVKIITENNQAYGMYHFSNEGVASWYDFAKAIFYESGIKIKVNPINTDAYKTDATRPKFSVLDKSKIKNSLQIEIPYWRDSLKRALIKLDK